MSFSQRRNVKGLIVVKSLRKDFLTLEGFYVIEGLWKIF